MGIGFYQMLFLFQPVNVIDYISSFSNVEQALHTCNKSFFWSWCIVLFIHFWTQFVNILLRNFANRPISLIPFSMWMVSWLNIWFWGSIVFASLENKGERWQVVRLLWNHCFQFSLAAKSRVLLNFQVGSIRKNQSIFSGVSFPSQAFSISAELWYFLWEPAYLVLRLLSRTMHKRVG